MNKIIIYIKHGCAEVRTSIPKDIELIIRDYDVEPEIADGKDDAGSFVERSYTADDHIRKKL